ncbi:MAG: hypothetical protein U7127_22425 [Phormidium sp.]
MSNKPMKDQRKENRESAEKKVNQVVAALKLTKDERKQLHDALGEDYLDYQEILARAKRMFDPYDISYKGGEQPRW